MTGKPIDEAVLTTVRFLDGGVVQMDRADYDRLTAAQQQGQAVAECHCATCTCAPGMTPAVRFDTSPAAQEGAIRDHLIALGWTPPGAQQKGQLDVGSPRTPEQIAATVAWVQSLADSDTAPQPMQQGGREVVAWMTPGGDVSRSFYWCLERCLPGQEPQPLYAAPPSAPVGVEAIAAEIRASLGRGATVSTRRRWAVELEALAQQPAAAEQASGGCKGPNCTASVTNDHKHSSECLFEHAANVASGIKSVEMGVEIAEHLTYVEWRGHRINLLAALAAQHQEPKS